MYLIALLIAILCGGFITGTAAGEQRIGNDLKSVTVAIMDVLHAPGPLAFQGDDSFLREVVGFNQDQIDFYTERAIEFYLTRYGLDFTQSVPDAQGNRHFENATLTYFTNDPTFGYAVVGNADLIASRIKVPEYYELRFGGWLVVFNGLQLLRGTYGGSDGILIGLLPAEDLAYSFYSCPTCPGGGLLMQWRTITPLRMEPVDQTLIFNFELTHDELGEGHGRGIVRIEPTADPSLFRYLIRLIWTFPGNGITC